MKQPEPMELEFEMHPAVLPTCQRFAVFGHPVKHSLSPDIHRQFAAQTGRVLEYQTIDIASEHFAEALLAFAASGARGASITLPHKYTAWTMCDELSDTARQAGTVNMVTVLAKGQLRGDNTDGIGLIRDLTEHHRVDIRGRRTLLLGAGGAAHGVVGPLLEAGVDELTICNRTPERADALADRIGDPARVHTRYWDDLAECGSFDLIIDCTSAGHHGIALKLPFSLAGNRSLCYSLSYGNAAQDFLAWAKAAHAAYALDGLGMLIEQAAVAFSLWHGVYPDTQPVYNELRKKLSA